MKQTGQFAPKPGPRLYPCARLHQLHFVPHRSPTLSQTTFLCHSLGQNVLKKPQKTKNYYIAALVVSETWNLLVFCCSFLCLGAWDTRQTWAIHPAVWMDVGNLLRQCYSKERKNTHKLDSTGNSGGHRSPPAQPARNSFFLRARAHPLLISPVDSENPFSRYTGSTGNYLSRGRGGTKRFYLAQSPSGGGARKQPGAPVCIPRERGSSQPARSSAAPAAQAMTPSLQNNLLLVLELLRQESRAALSRSL